MRYLYRSRESPHAKYEEAHADRNAVDDGSLEEITKSKRNNQAPTEQKQVIERKNFAEKTPRGKLAYKKQGTRRENQQGQGREPKFLG